MSKIKLHSGRIFKCSDDGDTYVLLHTPLGWIAYELAGSNVWGNPAKTPEMAVDGLEILPYKVTVINDRTHASHPDFTGNLKMGSTVEED